MIRYPRSHRPAVLLLLVYLTTTACDESANLLDFDELRRFLNLTPAQTEVISGHARSINAEVESYIQVVRQVRRELGRTQGRVDDREIVSMPQVEEARSRAVANIRKIANLIQAELTDEQLKKFDQIVLPDLQQSPQELEFLMMRSRRDTFVGLGVKPSARISIAGADTGKTYNALKEQRTIVFGPGGFSSGTERFPVFVTATLFDSILVEADIARIASSESIVGEEARSRRTEYLASKQAHDMFTIRLVLSTYLHESYVDPDRWVVFVEDHEGNQFEPDEIVEDFSMESPRPSDLVPRGFLGEGDIALARKAREIEIRFPYQDPFGRYILGPGTKLLRLVLFDRNDPASRTRGEWVVR